MQCFAGDKPVILMASSTGTPAARGSGVGSFRSSPVTWATVSSDEVFTKSGAYTNNYFIHIFTETKKYSCDIFLWAIILCSTRSFEHAEYDYEEVECLRYPIMPALSAM